MQSGCCSSARRRAWSLATADSTAMGVPPAVRAAARAVASARAARRKLSEVRSAWRANSASGCAPPASWPAHSSACQPAASEQAGAQNCAPQPSRHAAADAGGGSCPGSGGKPPASPAACVAAAWAAACAAACARAPLRRSASCVSAAAACVRLRQRTRTHGSQQPPPRQVDLAAAGSACMPACGGGSRASARLRKAVRRSTRAPYAAARQRKRCGRSHTASAPR